MDIVLNDQQAMILTQALQGIAFAGDGYKKHMNLLLQEGYMELEDNKYWHVISDKGKEFTKQYLESVYQVVINKLRSDKYNRAIFDISLETCLSVGILENIILEYFAEQGLLGKVADKDGNLEFIVK